VSVPPGPSLVAAVEVDHVAQFLGLPLWIWQLANLIAFLAVLLHFVAGPLAEAFRKRQLEVAERLRQALKFRADAARLEVEIHERLARLDQELEEIRARGVAEGEAARASLLERAEQESERVRREAEEEIQRRLAVAKGELRRTAADLTASVAAQLLAGEMTEKDRQRLFEESLQQLAQRS
jgi:F-type H+-transporting ATPase subunit b